ncbi:Glycosyltransferase family 28 N-terminal domain [Synechococcus sp. PCC 7335]|nr:Glycosyltransferase family 28 N-terminal domain [Synechococcus sp. PCC 7335]
MANITILTIGSRGDIQPYCAIALGLMRKGHNVTLAGSSNFASFAACFNIPFLSVSGNFKTLLSSPIGLDLLEGDSVRLIDDELLWQQMSDAWNACKDSELIVFSPITLWGYHIAEALGVPGILATLLPTAQTRAFPFLKFSQRTDGLIRGLGNLLSYRLVKLLLWRRYAEIINRFRKEVLNLPQISSPFGPSYRYSSGLRMPVVNCYSPAVIPPPPDWGNFVHQAGYCFLDTADSFNPPLALQTFLDKGPKPFYVGFGSMIPRHPQRLAQTIISALAVTGQRAILCSGWGEVSTAELPDSIYLLKEVPHDWLFPKVVAAIHHGGGGTTAATLRAGIPSIVVSFFADQPIWGEQLEQLGVSPATHLQMELTSDRLAKSIRSIVASERFSKRAQQLQAQIEQENGVDSVVSIVESYLPS